MRLLTVATTFGAATAALIHAPDGAAPYLARAVAHAISHVGEQLGQAVHRIRNGEHVSDPSRRSHARDGNIAAEASFWSRHIADDDDVALWEEEEGEMRVADGEAGDSLRFY